jgi:heme/copper-type cytochrome/quinol oxidase subunit 3
MMLLFVSGLVYTAVAAFRYLGGRTKELEIVSASALYWYFLTVAFTAVWFVVYVQK